MTIMTLTQETARKLMLASLGLATPPSAPATKAGLLEAIRRMHVLQIDTINVIARSPYLVLWTRLGAYPPEWLDELLAEGALFEYWAHAACFLPIEDYPLYRRRMLDVAQYQTWPLSWAVKFSKERPDLINRIRAHIVEHGAVRSAEFENKNHRSGGWWDWKEEKDALEALLFTGEVMIARRQNFQRVYDLRERVLPAWDDAQAPASEEVERSLAIRAVHALGVALPNWTADYFRQPKKSMPKVLEALAAEGRLLRAEIEGLKGPAYLHPERLALLEKAASDGLASTQTTLLSPFDPLVWDRQRARDLFHFDYAIECYTPVAKRRYGYFTLPILHHGQLVGRLDPKAHRARGIFEAKSIHLEPGVAVTPELVEGLAGALRRLASWHGATEVVIGTSQPPELALKLRVAI